MTQAVKHHWAKRWAEEMSTRGTASEGLSPCEWLFHLLRIPNNLLDLVCYCIVGGARERR